LSCIPVNTVTPLKLKQATTPYVMTNNVLAEMKQFMKSTLQLLPIKLHLKKSQKLPNESFNSFFCYTIRVIQ